MDTLIFLFTILTTRCETAETSSTVVIDTAESDSAVSSLRCHKILCFDLCKIAVKEIIIKYKKYFGRTLLYRIGKILFCKGGYLW